MPKLFHAHTNKQGLIVYSGEASSDFGMVVAEAPSFEKPTKRTEVFTVPGRNGAVIFQDGSYEDTVRTYRAWIASDREEARETLADKVNALTAWLFSNSGYNRLEDSFEPDVFRLAYYSGTNDVSNELTQYGETTLTFTCRPERFLKNAETPLEISNGDTIANPTRFSSKPLIYIEASGVVTVSINGASIEATVADYINIDCERMNAYRLPSENRNDKVSGTFPQIAPGMNGVGISVTGTLTKVAVTPRYFTI